MFLFLQRSFWAFGTIRGVCIRVRVGLSSSSVFFIHHRMRPIDRAMPPCRSKRFLRSVIYSYARIPMGNERLAPIPNNAEVLMTHIMTDKTLWRNGSDLDLRSGNPSLDERTFRFERQDDDRYYHIVNVLQEQENPQNKYVFANEQNRIHLHNNNFPNHILWEPIIHEGDGCTSYAFRHKATGRFMYNGVSPNIIHLRERGQAGDENYIRWCLRPRSDDGKSYDPKTGNLVDTGCGPFDGNPCPPPPSSRSHVWNPMSSGFWRVGNVPIWVYVFVALVAGGLVSAFVLASVG